MIKAIIIDDEVKAASFLKLIIEDIDKEIQILDMFNDPKKGLEYLNSHNDEVDLVFIDIEMPIMSGLDLLDKVENPNFEIIFVTGYSQYAIQAFQFCAIGYILKPVDEDDLIIAINNAKKRIRSQHVSDQNKILISNLKEEESSKRKIGVQTNDGLIFIYLKDIIRCEALQKVTKLVSKQGELISSYNIGHFAKLLEEFDFFQVHKSHLVNVNAVSKLSKDGFVVLNNNSEIPIARRRKTEFTNYMSNR